MKLILCSTSFLLPGNPAWAELAKHHELNFAGYDEWSSLMLGDGRRFDETNALVWLPFLDDLFPLSKQSELQSMPSMKFQEALDSFFATVLTPLDSFLERHPSLPVVVAWSAADCGSPIESAREPTTWQRVRAAWQENLYQRSSQHANLLLLDLDRQFSGPGWLKCFDDRNYFTSHCRLSMTGIKTVALSLASILDRYERAAHKVLVLDCDNTLWGGVIGEDGLSGIVLGQDGLGQAYQEFQTVCRYLATQGVVLALCSKNNEEDVWDVFDKHQGMVLKKKDIIGARINWRPKAHNLPELADEFGLGLDSLVFWDDNPLERAQVKEALPMAEVPEVPEQVVYWPRFLRSSNWFSRFMLTEEDRKKSLQYRMRAQFQEAARGQADETTFLRDIGLTPRQVPIEATSLSRAAQLSTKTNQFNLRVVRRDEAAIMELCNRSGGMGFLGGLSDRFGDHGIVGMVLLSPTPDPMVGFLDTYLLSCRVLGRHFEAWLLSRLALKMREAGYRWLLAEHRPAPRNQMCAGFLVEHGLKKLHDWEPEIRQKMEMLANEMSPEAPPQTKRFLADLHELDIPFLDLYNHDQA